MSIQVLSSALLNAPPNPAAATGADGLPADTAGNFADLLAQQMLAPAMIALDPQGKTTVDPKSDAKLLEDTTALVTEAGEDAALLSQSLPWLPHTAGLPLRPDLAGRQEKSDKEGLPTQLASMIGEKLAATPAQAQADERAAPLKPGFEIGANRPSAPLAEALSNHGGNTPTAFANEMGQASERLAANFADSKPETPVNLPQTQATHTPSQAAREIATPIPTALHDNRWATDFGQKVVWMARAEQQNAQININPPQLGPIQISINLNGDNASATFASPHAEVRQALETALPRLREMLADAGINLGQANVGSQFAQQQQNPQENRQAASDSPRLAVDNAILSGQSGVAAGSTVAPSRGQGLVDLFA